MGFIRISTPKGYSPPHPINIKGYGRLIHIQSNKSTFTSLQTLILFQPLHAVHLLISTTRDGRKDKCSDLNVIDEKSINVLETSAIDGKGREKLTFDIPNAKSEQSELKKPKIKKKIIAVQN